jgi:hypothetical protein
MHYQAVVLEDEIGQPIEIESISFMPSEDGYGPYSWEYGMSIYMGLTDQDQLSPYFESNYLPGTKQLVLYADSVFYGCTKDVWQEIVLDDPFLYTEGNLVIEVLTPEWGGYTRIYNWDAGMNRALYTYMCSSPQGNLTVHLPYMMFSGALSLEQETFGAIKVILGRE